MGWREQLLPASFRGAAFEVLDHTFDGGRRNVVHEYPQRDNPFVEDLGRKVRRFRMEGFILGDDYFARRDRLIDKCTSRGEGKPGGELIHPYFGAVQVVCESIRVRETFTDGRMCRLALSFTEAGVEPRPVSRGNAGALADAQSSSLNELSSAQIISQVKNAGGFAQQARDAAAGVLEETGGLMSGMTLSGLTQDVAAFRDQATSMIDNAAVLATSPASLAAAIWDAGEAIFQAAGNALEALFAYEVLFGVDNTLGGLSSSSEAAADLYKKSASDVVYAAAVGGGVRSAVRADFASLADAESSRDRLAVQIDALSESGADDGTYGALRDLLSTLVDGVPNPAAQLPDVQEIILAAPLPSLVLAWNQYGDTSREAELVARIHPPRPGFLPAGVPLQVLVDAL